jgi:hypothetical protein
MIRFLVLAGCLLTSVPAFAMPQFLQLYRSDPFRNPAFDGCQTCHMSPEGGDARNPFGQAFESGGETITPMLRAQFPDRFVYPTSRVSDALTIHFSDPDKKQVVVEAGGAKHLVDVNKRAVDGRDATNPSAPAQAVSEIRPAVSSEVRVDPYAREGAFFGSNIVNLPNGKPQRKGGVDFFIGHRFSQNVSDAGLGGLFGFDSSALVAYGVRVGLTNRVSVNVLRSNAAGFKTISLGSAFQVSRQGGRAPFTTQVRIGVDGKNNFGIYHRKNPPFDDRQYSPYIQIVGTRTFKERVSFTLVPTYAFNTRDESQGDNLPDPVRTEMFGAPAFGTSHNNTIALGIGVGVRFLRTTSLVGEFIPRLGGFKGEEVNRPGVSIGLQKSTLRHTFELLIARQRPMTPALYSFQGADTFTVGFNIYRKLR